MFFVSQLQDSLFAGKHYASQVQQDSALDSFLKGDFR